MKFAIIKTGGKQYKVAVNDTLVVEKIQGTENKEISFDQVLMTGDDDKEKAVVTLGTPYVGGASVSGTILTQGRGKKITVIKYKAKTRHRRKRGHRQLFTAVKITDIKG